MRTLDARIACYDPTMDPAVDVFRGPLFTSCGMSISRYRLQSTWVRLHDVAQSASRRSLAIGNDFAVRIQNCARLDIERWSQSDLEDNPRASQYQLVITPMVRVVLEGCFPADASTLPDCSEFHRAVGCGFDRPWRNVRSWDKFAIPRPSSRARIVLGQGFLSRES